MKTPVYIISFGDSTKYRFTPGEDSLASVQEDIKKYIADKFPELSALGFYDKITVVKVDGTNEEKYLEYPEFGKNSIDEIKKVLSREIETAQSVRELNQNAPWGSD